MAATYHLLPLLPSPTPESSLDRWEGQEITHWQKPQQQRLEGYEQEGLRNNKVVQYKKLMQSYTRMIPIAVTSDLPENTSSVKETKKLNWVLKEEDMVQSLEEYCSKT